MMLAQFRPIAEGNYYPPDVAGNPVLALEYKSNANNTLCTYFNNKTDDSVPGGSTYKSYWESVYYLLAIFVFFRVMVIVSLVLQDTKFGEAAGDTRNQNIGQPGAQ